MEKDKKKAGKLATYATILLLMVIIVIIIAAMADDREKTFQMRIEETTQTNLTIQDEIVSLKDENYQLKKKIEELEKTNNETVQATETNAKLDEIWNLLKDDKKDEAKSKFEEIDKSALPEQSKTYYEAISEIIND